MNTHLEGHALELVTVELSGTGQDGGCLARPRGPVEEQMRQLVLMDECADCFFFYF